MTIKPLQPEENEPQQNVAVVHHPAPVADVDFTVENASPTSSSSSSAPAAAAAAAAAQSEAAQQQQPSAPPAPPPPPAPSHVVDQQQQQQQQHALLQNLNFAWSAQKPLQDLSLHDLLMYRNLYVSVALLLTGNLFFLLITRYEYSVITLIGRIILLQTIFFFVFVIGSRVLNNSRQALEIPASRFTVSEEMIAPIVQCVVNNVNRGLRSYVDILLCKDLGTTMRFALGVQFVCWLGEHIPGHVLIYLVFLVSFTVPKVHEVKRKEIHAFVDNAKQQVINKLEQLLDRIPPEMRDKLDMVRMKVEELTRDRLVAASADEKKNQ